MGRIGIIVVLCLALSSWTLRMQKEKVVVKTISEINSNNTTIALQRKLHYTEAEMMEVASKFFFCDEVLADSAVVIHVCRGINGTYELNWNKDFEKLADFCYATIIKNWNNENYPIGTIAAKERDAASVKFKSLFTSKEQYLKDVGHELMRRMEHCEKLRECLLENYALQKKSLPFVITANE